MNRVLKSARLGTGILPILLIAGTVSANAGRAPQGFRLKSGTLIRWGESREAAIANSGRIGLPALSMTMSAVSCDKNQPCMAAADAVPSPYHNAAFLWFNDDKFYGVQVGLPSDKFQEAERGIVQALGVKPKREVSAVQNGFGATFERIDDTWNIGHVSILLRSLNEADEGILVMRYKPRVLKNTQAAPALF